MRSVQSGPSREVLEGVADLAELDPAYLLPELFLQVEEAAVGADMNALSATPLIPDTGVVSKVVSAVVGQDLDMLRATVDGDYADLVVLLVAVVAALRGSSASS